MTKIQSCPLPIVDEISPALIDPLRGSECYGLISTVIIAMGPFMSQTIEIHIRLLDEGTECSRPTQALDLGDVRKCPPTFCEVQHFALDFGERDVFALGFRNNLGNQELLGFPFRCGMPSCGGFYSPFQRDGAANWRKIPIMH